MKKIKIKALYVGVFFLLLIPTAVSFAKEGFKYDRKGKRDPFLTLVTKEGKILPGARAFSESDNINLEGIIWDPKGESVALVNGRLVKEGDSFQGIQILKIKKETIIVQRKNKVFMVDLKKGEGTEYEVE